MELSIGITAYNEEKAIPRLMRSIWRQELPPTSVIKEIIIVSSGSTDNTNKLVKQFQEKDPRIVLIEEPEKRGKPAALNMILSSFKGDIIVHSGADGIYKKDALHWICSAFTDPSVAAVCGHPVPVNSRSSLWGHGSFLLWEMHHLISLAYPQKLSGELLAIKKQYVKPIPENAGADDVYLERNVMNMGGKIVYAPKSCIFILGPQTAADYFRQRRRVMSHVYYAEMISSIKSPTSDYRKILRLFTCRFRSLFKASSFPVITVEMLARFLAMHDARSGKVVSNWTVIQTTKDF